MSFDPVTAVLEIGGKIIDRVWPDPVQAATAKLELVKMQQNGELAVIAGQLDINKTEAANNNLWVAGWRPFVGWICGVAFAYKFVLAPFIVLGLNIAGRTINLPVLDFTEMSTILLGMLGLGGMRTIEKLNDKA